MARGEVPGACQRRTPLPQAQRIAQVELQGGQMDDETSHRDSGRREISKGSDTHDGPKKQESEVRLLESELCMFFSWSRSECCRYYCCKIALLQNWCIKVHFVGVCSSDEDPCAVNMK
jgi:hypothetical protein